MNNIVLIDGITDIEGDGDAIARNDDSAHHRRNAPNRWFGAGIRRCSGLCVLARCTGASKSPDDIAAQLSAVCSAKRWKFFVPEIILKDGRLTVLSCYLEIISGAPVVAIE